MPFPKKAWTKNQKTKTQTLFAKFYIGKFTQGWHYILYQEHVSTVGGEFIDAGESCYMLENFTVGKLYIISNEANQLISIIF